jgi:hypothetical protein
VVLRELGAAGLNSRLPTEVLGVEKVTVVVFDVSNMAVDVGTVAGVQLLAVLKSPDPGAASQVDCAWAANIPGHIPTITSKTLCNTRKMKLPLWRHPELSATSLIVFRLSI